MKTDHSSGGSRITILSALMCVKIVVLQQMKDRARRWSPDIRQIDLDVNRTYRNHIMFRRRFDVKLVTSVFTFRDFRKL